MKFQINTIVGFVIALCVMLVLSHYAEAQQHRWHNGYVKGISKGVMNVDDNSFTVDSKVKVVLQIKTKGRIQEDPVKFSEVKVGDRVSVKLIGDVIKEIIIERY